jgi:exopolysaccharide biosynthesis protein
VGLSLEVVPLLHPENKKRWNQFDDIVGGTPLLVDQKNLITDFSSEKTRIPFLEDRHSRTAIGIKANGNLLFVVVDGRQPNISIGMTMHELAQYMFDLGAFSALNLDGGGSSTMYLNGRVINDPASGEDDNKAEGEERAVSDAILIFTKE